jgi:formylglycine-generating enzyme required for sulfatase activity
MKRAAICLVVCAFACGSGQAEPRPQWVLEIDTDVPVAQFGDQLLVEVLARPDEVPCAGCRRLFALDTNTVWPLSFGVAQADSSTEPYVRARQYRRGYVGPDGLPSSPALVDVLQRLPPPSGVTRVDMHMRMGCFGVPACDPAGVSRWSVAPDQPCRGADVADMVCVPGGAFLLGAPNAFVQSDVLAPNPERLVVLSPFRIDVDELTVGRVRALAASHTLAQPPTGRSAGSDLTSMCTYLGPGDATNDALPVNCVSYAGAQELCALLGKRLPTEAEWEYVAGNRDAETEYPWYVADDLCAYAIVGRGRYPDEMTATLTEDTSCRTRATSTMAFGPVANGSPRDLTLLRVHDLGGSLSEWVADTLVPYSDACWAGASPLVDPRCDAPGDVKSLRGGSWSSRPIMMRATMRNGLSGSDSYTGVRCARDAR